MGTTASVSFDAPEVGAGLDRLLQPFRRPLRGPAGCRYSVTAPGSGWVLSVDGECRSPARTWPAAAADLLADLNQRALTAFGGLAVHAGVVAAGGAAVAFPAPSGAGKSTLTAACLEAGFDYVSDEALCLDLVTAAVVPYPRPILLSDPSVALAGISARGLVVGDGEVAFTPGDLGAPVARAGLRLAHVVKVHRRPGPPVLVPLERVDTVSALLGLSFNHYRQPLDCFSLATRVARSAQIWRLDYDDPPAAARLLSSLPPFPDRFTRE